MRKKLREGLSLSEQEKVLQLMMEHRESIRRTIVFILDGQWPDAVDDILQDTYEEMCKQLEHIQKAENPRAYICKITARLTIREKDLLSANLPLNEDICSAEITPSNLDEILPKELSLSDKKLLQLVYGDRESIVNIAKDFGKTDTAIRQQLKRARDRFKKFWLNPFSCGIDVK